MLVKTEYENQIKTYQNLYQSSIAYGIRSYLMIEEEKKNMKQENETMEEECETLTSDIEKLEDFTSCLCGSHYKLGAFVHLNKTDFEIRYYKDGEQLYE